jgi:hypothetical protein
MMDKTARTVDELMALCDRKGVILAAAAVGAGYAGPVPVAGKGQKVVRVALPEGLAGMRADAIDLRTLCEGHRVDAKAARLIAAALD